MKSLDRYRWGSVLPTVAVVPVVAGAPDVAVGVAVSA